MTTNTATAVIASTVATAEKKAKTVNYTPEQTASVIAQYKAGVPVEKIAETFAKTTRSIIAKLTKELVYVKPGYKTKTGADPVSKEELVLQLEKLIGVEAGSFDSLEKATKPVLNKLVAAFQFASDILTAECDDGDDNEPRAYDELGDDAASFDGRYTDEMGLKRTASGKLDLSKN